MLLPGLLEVKGTQPFRNTVLLSILQATRCTFWVQKPQKLGMAALHRREGSGGPTVSLYIQPHGLARACLFAQPGAAPSFPRPIDYTFPLIIFHLALP